MSLFLRSGSSDNLPVRIKKLMLQSMSSMTGIIGIALNWILSNDRHKSHILGYFSPYSPLKWFLQEPSCLQQEWNPEHRFAHFEPFYTFIDIIETLSCSNWKSGLILIHDHWPMILMFTDRAWRKCSATKHSQEWRWLGFQQTHWCHYSTGNNNVSNVIDNYFSKLTDVIIHDASDGNQLSAN